MALLLFSMIAFLVPIPPLFLAGGILAAAMLFVMATLTIWFVVARIAVTSGGWLYGVMHSLLMVLFTPILMGLFVVPSLVLGDLHRWREWDGTHLGGTGGHLLRKPAA